MTKGAKWKTLLVTLISCLLLTAFIYPITIHVDETVDGILLSSQDGTAEPVQVKQNGTYYWKVFGADEMTVQLEALGQGGAELKRILGYTQWEPFYYTYPEDNRQNDTVKGNLSYRPFANRGELVILTQSAGEGGNPAQCLVFSAKDRESALKILKKLAPEQYDSFANGAS